MSSSISYARIRAWARTFIPPAIYMWLARREPLIVVPIVPFLLMFVAAQVVFAGWPQIDLAVSQVFFDDHFVAARLPGLEDVRQVLWMATIVMFLLAVIMAFATALTRIPFPIQSGAWAYIALVYLAAPGILVNGVLKEYWGRARPADVSVFGGDAVFTPAFQIASECASNCSFVSGEVAGTTAFAIALFVLARQLSDPYWSTPLRWIACASVVIVALQRVSTGRHFLSDAVFAILITVAVALLIDFGQRLLWKSKGVQV
ncbi:MAG: phosphatase PAP2 family protein [Pseudomonadota bacterium]